MAPLVSFISMTLSAAVSKEDLNFHRPLCLSISIQHQLDSMIDDDDNTHTNYYTNI